MFFLRLERGEPAIVEQAPGNNGCDLVTYRVWKNECSEFTRLLLDFYIKKSLLVKPCQSDAIDWKMFIYYST